MITATDRSDHRPRWLRRRVSTYWWLEKPSYFAFILREASCVFVAWFVVYLLMLVDAVNAGPSAYQALLDWSATPAILALNVVSFLFLVFHAVTFFDAAPQAMVVHLGGKRVPGQLIGIGHYAAWAVVSVGIAWILVGV
jgi:fumarate reductase subunit C